MIGRYKHWLPFALINMGIRLLPRELRNTRMITNCMTTGHIKVNEVCGGCHTWGANPFIKNGKCETCNRTEAQIQSDHGVVFLLSEEMDG